MMFEQTLFLAALEILCGCLATNPSPTGAEAVRSIILHRNPILPIEKEDAIAAFH
ncbi:MAG TPA: hypothetical protein V6D29_23975 [Leptolyngbyaceae cyanobacterium]